MEALETVAAYEQSAAQARRGSSTSPVVVKAMDDALAGAKRHLEKVSKPVPFPINVAFSSDGAALARDIQRTWFACKPDIHVVKDDKKQFYPEASRPAFFEALHDPKRAAFAGYIPLWRGWYSRPTRIFVSRGGGELCLPAAMLDEVMEDALTTTGRTYIDECCIQGLSDEQAFDQIMVHARQIRGFQQGCVLATFGSLFKYQLALHDVQRKLNKKGHEFYVLTAFDDGLFAGDSSTIYEDCELMDELYVAEACDARHNQDKRIAICASGGVDGIPDAWLLAQGGVAKEGGGVDGGEVHGIVFMGYPMAVNTPEGKQWQTATLTDTFNERLAFLDVVDAMRDDVDENDTKQIQYGYLSRVARRVWCTKKLFVLVRERPYLVASRDCLPLARRARCPMCASA